MPIQTIGSQSTFRFTHKNPVSADFHVAFMSSNAHYRFNGWIYSCPWTDFPLSGVPHERKTKHPLTFWPFPHPGINNKSKIAINTPHNPSTNNPEIYQKGSR